MTLSIWRESSGQANNVDPDKKQSDRVCTAYFGSIAVWENNKCSRFRIITQQRYDYNEPCHEKTCLRDFRPGKTQTGLLTYRSKLVS